jgi:DNA-binding transcriptional regulator YhcF (GntR family)
VSRYVKRYNSGGMEALVREPGKAAISEYEKNRICKAGCTEKPENATPGSTRELAKQFSISHNTVTLVLRERGIKPYVVKKGNGSTDPRFEEKLTDVVGL